jgi:hypothetical protein
MIYVNSFKFLLVALEGKMYDVIWRGKKKQRSPHPTLQRVTRKKRPYLLSPWEIARSIGIEKVFESRLEKKESFDSGRDYLSRGMVALALPPRHQEKRQRPGAVSPSCGGAPPSCGGFLNPPLILGAKETPTATAALRQRGICPCFPLACSDPAPATLAWSPTLDWVLVCFKQGDQAT